MIVDGQAQDPLISDAQLAGLAIEYGGVLHTTDRDFARFPGLRWALRGFLAEAAGYSTWHWKQLSRFVKCRDNKQCQICGDRQGDPYCVLHAHHITPRPGGPDTSENVITLCDLCHAVVTPRWHRPWFGDLTPEQRIDLEKCRQEFWEFLSLDPNTRLQRQTLLWTDFGITNTAPILGN